MSVSFRNALCRKTARWTTPAGRFVNCVRAKSFGVPWRPVRLVSDVTRFPQKRRDRPFSSLFGGFLSESSGHTPGVARQTYFMLWKGFARIASRDALRGSMRNTANSRRERNIRRVSERTAGQHRWLSPHADRRVYHRRGPVRKPACRRAVAKPWARLLPKHSCEPATRRAQSG